MTNGQLGHASMGHFLHSLLADERLEFKYVASCRRLKLNIRMLDTCGSCMLAMCIVGVGKCMSDIVHAGLRAS